MSFIISKSRSLFTIVKNFLHVCDIIIRFKYDKYLKIFIQSSSSKQLLSNTRDLESKNQAQIFPFQLYFEVKMEPIPNLPDLSLLF